MSWMDNINTIKEIYPGHFQIILDFASNKFINHILSDDYKYCWVYNCETQGSGEWQNYQLPILDNIHLESVIARNISFSFILPTSEFRKLLPKLRNGIAMAQVNILPKYYLDPSRIKWRTRYDLLKKECDYLFEIDLPAAIDYGTIRSSNRDYLQSLLDNEEINWSDLP
jgi:hypothetical protein